ncbi:MAG TPA: c-type cytochrome, partial [Chitinophagaceae bacterium]
MKTSIVLTAVLFTGSLFVLACKEGVKKDEKPIDIQKLSESKPETHGAEIKEGDIKLTNPLDTAMVSGGKAIYDLKCHSCHNLTDVKLVGPGWLGVTKRRSPTWILNMITNVDMMLETDPEAQKLLELCMVRMPNQNLMIEDARKVLEFQRSNDG